jgi:pimeloyl-ACP methyl ester carboxylesterase
MGKLSDPPDGRFDRVDFFASNNSRKARAAALDKSQCRRSQRGHVAASDALTGLALPRDFYRRRKREVQIAFWGWNDVWLEPAFASFNLREELARICVPMLVLRGDNDRYGAHHQVEIAKDLCACPLQTLIIPTCGHVPHREQPEQTLNAIATFYRSVALSEDRPVPPKRGLALLSHGRQLQTRRFV